MKKKLSTKVRIGLPVAVHEFLDHIKILVVDLVTRVLYWMYYVVSFYVFCKLYVYLRDLERYYATLKSDKEVGPE